MRNLHTHTRTGIFLLLCMIFCAACSSGLATAPEKATPTQTELDSTPKGPGSTALTATALSTPVTGTCPSTGSIPPANTTGWQTYQDPRYHFSFAIPPQWRAGAFSDINGDYIAQLLPPGTTIPFGIETGSNDHFDITIPTGGQQDSSFPAGSWHAEAKNIAIGNTMTALYDKVFSPPCIEVDRYAATTIGKQYFVFFFNSHSTANASGEIALFLGVLQSFQT